MQHDIPRNGALSGMIITALTAAVTLPVVYFIDDVRTRFEQPLPSDASSMFFVGALVMAAHKFESYLAAEYEQCPVYLTQRRSWESDPGRALFVTFVTTFIGMLFVVALVLIGPPWHLAIITIWLAQGLHELHHIAKSVSRRTIYPGLWTSLLFIGVQSGLLFPWWHDVVIGERHAVFAVYYLLLPAIALAFYIEDRRWTRRTPRDVWDPRIAPSFASPIQVSTQAPSERRAPLQIGARMDER